MGKPFGFNCPLDYKLLVIKPYLTSIGLNRQFLTYTTSQLIVVGFLFSFTGRSSFKGLFLYLKFP